MPDDLVENDNPPTYDEATSASFPFPLLQPSIVSPQDQEYQEPHLRQTGVASHLPSSHVDDSLYISSGLSPLHSMHALTVSTKSAYLHNIKDISKQLVFTAEVSAEEESSSCCDKITIRTIDKQPLALCEVASNKVTRWSEPPRSITVSSPLSGEIIGHITRKDYCPFAITTPDGDVVLTIRGNPGFWSTKPFKIIAHDGSQIGSIERIKFIKNRLIFPGNLSVQLKILLLSTAIHIQAIEAERRRNTTKDLLSFTHFA